MGKFSRDKGMRQEYLLRDYLRKLGWTADRVPSSGAAEGFKGDIKAEKNGRTVLFELKARAPGVGQGRRVVLRLPGRGEAVLGP